MRKNGAIRIDPGRPEPERVARVAEHLREGGVVAYPTETVYGFGCALRPQALERIVRLKRRDPGKPLLLLVRERGDVEGLRWTPAAETLAAAFWPGPLTLVLSDEERRLPPEVRSGEGGVAVRATPHPVARALLEALGEPITSTSANAPGHPPARSAEEAREALLGLLEGTPLAAGGVLPGWLRIVDAGPLPPSESSTVVGFSGGRVRVLRQGAVSLEALRAVRPEAEGPETRG